MSAERANLTSTKSLILVPAVITLAVTLLRLTGELMGWSPLFFSRQAGGAGAIVGIVWLVPVFGIYFAWKLAQAGQAPTGGSVVGHAVLAVALVAASVWLGSAVLKLSQNAVFVVITLAGLVAAYLAYRGWPALGRTLLAYGLAARVPVAIVMLVAILANWGTHYDVAPPGFPEMGPVPRWLMIGLVPQILLWVPFTMIVGAICGGLTLLAVGRGRQPATV